MPIVKRIVCLANSRKLRGRCIAGKELAGKTPGWIRPISAAEHGEVSEYERQYSDGSDPRLLDVMEVPLLEARGEGYQQENWLLDPDQYWRKVDRMEWTGLQKLADPEAPLWVNGHSTYNGHNDQIPLAEAGALKSSLRLIRVKGLSLSVFCPGGAFGNPKRRVQARISFAGVEYRLWVTDPVYERKYLAKADGEYQLGESFLTISLGEPYNNACFKLVAAIIERETGAAR